MTSTTGSPGFEFERVRLLSAQYEFVREPREGESADVGFNYGDKVEIEGLRVVVTQVVNVQLVSSADSSQVLLRAHVVLEGQFQGTPDAVLDAERFGNQHAPAILFAFTREWIHRLTSAAHPWPPIIIPPVNVLQLRQDSNAGSVPRSPL